MKSERFPLVFRLIVTVLSTVLIMIACTSCDDDTGPSGYVPPPFRLEISFFENHAPAADTMEPVQIVGRVIDPQDKPQVDFRVLFSVTPPEQGNITPFARTDPADVEDGFNGRVFFTGKEYGFAMIHAVAENPQEEYVGADSLKIQVRPAPNE